MFFIFSLLYLLCRSNCSASTTIAQEVTRPQTTSTNDSDVVVCVPMAPIEGFLPHENEFDPVLCTVVSTKTNITCYPQQKVLRFPPSGTLQRILCRPFNEIRENYVICAPLSEVSQGLQNSEGVPPIKCEMWSNKKIISCYPKERIVFPTFKMVSCTPTDVDLFVCFPLSPVDGPPNFYGIPQIKCQKVVGNTAVECYPNRVINFPWTVPERILCFPIPPEPKETSLLKSSATSPPADPTPTEPVLCQAKEKFLGGVPNDQGISPIRCQLVDCYTIIKCYPPSEITDFPSNPLPTQCTPMPPVPVVCSPVGPIDGATPNSDGIYPIQCMYLFDNVTISCFPSYLVTFPLEFSTTRVMCLTLYT